MTSIGMLAESMRAFWEQRDPRERTAITLGAVAVAAMLIYALLVAPAIRGRLELSQALPLLRQQAAELEALTRQAAQLGPAGSIALQPPTKQGIEESLGRKGLKAQSVAVDGSVARVRLTAISFALLLDWLADAQKVGQLAAVEANIVVLPSLDSVDATLTLRQKSGEGLE